MAGFSDASLHVTLFGILLVKRHAKEAEWKI